MEYLTPPTAEVLLRVVWMGCRLSDSVIPFGSGVIATREGEEYLVTANHVAANCNYDPLVRYKNEWLSLNWKVVADSTQLDVTVLQSNTKFISADNPLSVRYGFVKGVIHGQVGYALGFPRFMDASGFNLNHISVMGHRPIPLPAILIVNLDSAYSASYINDGYSGGAIVARIVETGQWTVLGVIKHVPLVNREVLKRINNNNGTVNYEKTDDYVVQEHTGLIGYTPWSRIEQLISDAKQ